MKDTASIIVKNATIVTMDKERRILRNAAVAVEGTTIVDVGPVESVASKFEAVDQEVDAEGMAVLPGLINCHTHTLQCLGKGFGEDMTLIDWLNDFMLPLRRAATEKAHEAAAVHACIESIRSGATCLVDNILPNASQSLTGRIAKCYQKAGVRGLLARPIALTYDMTMDPASTNLEDKELNITEKIVSEWKSRKDDLVWACPSPAAIWRVSRRVLEDCREMSQRYNVPVHSHIAEVPEEVESTLKRYGRREIEFIGDLGLLGPRFHAAHSIWVSDGEIDLLAKSGTNVVHCPISNMYVRSGIAKIPQMVDKGVNVTLGTDGGCVGSAHDMLELMKVTALLHKVNPHGQTKITPLEILKMATVNGARAIGREHELGSIETGKKADFFLLDLLRTHSIPMHDVLSSIVFYSHSSDVKTVVINGKIVMKDGTITTVDEAKALKETASEASDLAQEIGLKTDLKLAS